MPSEAERLSLLLKAAELIHTAVLRNRDVYTHDILSKLWKDVLELAGESPSAAPSPASPDAELRELRARREEVMRIPVHLWPETVGLQKAWNMHRTSRLEALDAAIAAREKELEGRR
jgi:hypothetical protein